MARAEAGSEARGAAMRRRDSEKMNPTNSERAEGGGREGSAARRTPGRAARMALAGLALSFGAAAEGGTIRVWSTAVVTEDNVRLVEVAELQGFDAATSEQIGAVRVAVAPEAGGSKFVSLDEVREAVRTAGVNLAEVRMQGAKQCAVSRPAGSKVDSVVREKGRTYPFGGAAHGSGEVESGDAEASLRRAVRAFLEGELARYGGRVEVSFDRAAEGVLELSGPAYRFEVRRRGGAPPGLTPVEVDVVHEGKLVQTVPLMAQVRLYREVVTARRAINQDAQIRPEDVEATTVSVSRLDQAGFDETRMVIGQRAKRFIPMGTTITPDVLESVPLVRRGELVTLEAVVGGVSVVTSAKADGEGRLHEVIRVRSLDGKREEFDAVVVGAGKVRLRGPVEHGEALAWRGPS